MKIKVKNWKALEWFLRNYYFDEFTLDGIWLEDDGKLTAISFESKIKKPNIKKEARKS